MSESMKRLFLFCLTFCTFSSTALADAMVDFGAVYVADTLNNSTNSGTTQYFYNIDVLFNLDNRKAWNVGWTVFGLSQTFTEDTSSTVYSTMDMGPALRWNITRNGSFSTTLAYGYLAKGNYNASGGSAEELEGTSLFAQIASQLPLYDDKFYFGLSLNYYAANYSKKTVSNLRSASDAQKTWIFPMISFTWRP